MSVYTKKGDTGFSSTLTRKNISKDDVIFEVLGEIDELNSYFGKIRSKQTKKKLFDDIKNIQNNFFVINAILAGSKLSFPKEQVKKLEKEIDKMEKRLPVLSSFILPGGTKLAADLFYVRTLVRKIERKLVGLKKIKNLDNLEEILTYINRLSDALFVMARWENFRMGKKEEIWKPTK